MVTSEVVLDVVSHIITREEKVEGMRRGMPLFAYTIKSHTWRDARGERLEAFLRLFPQ